MLKIYSWLTGRLQTAEFIVEKKIKNRLVNRQIGLFSIGLVFLDLELFVLELMLNMARFFIVIFLDSGRGFNVVFRQQELHTCPFSYATYKDKQKKLRTFSFGTMATMVIAVGVVSLVMNLLFGNKLTGWAQTFAWQQTSWTNGASSTAVANHASNQTGWTQFSSSTSNIATTTGGAITLTASSVVAFNHTADADFNGIKSPEIYVSGGSVRLAKPFGASCTTDIECTDGVGGVTGGWCDTTGGSICRNPWQIKTAVGNSAIWPAGYVAAAPAATTPCSTILNSVAVLRKDNLPGIGRDWATAIADCSTIGGRLPAMGELYCISQNQALYNGAFQLTSYWSSTENISVFAWYVTFNGSTQFYDSKSLGLNVRCVKG